jgi:fructan beta-fructosidase
MNTIKIATAICFFMLVCACKNANHGDTRSAAHDRTITVSKHFLNLPVSLEADRARISFESDGLPESDFVIRLAASNPDYWVFYDVSSFTGKKITIRYAGNPEGLGLIFQDDRIAGQDSLYREKNRPQIHFTSRRGWNNDPNGLVYYEGEYHLFYQHNPFEVEWENMSWGHAISMDLVHWKELPVVMTPDTLGSIFSGTAVIDYSNTSGFGKEGNPPMVAVYTANSPGNERQCIAFSNDRGRTFTKYPGNPVIDSKAKWNSTDLRDPKVFWYPPAKNWVMVLFERDGNSIYTSRNLKEWQYESHIAGFWECPQLFELPVDGNIHDKKWVMYGASGTYMIGKFDGKKFTPVSGKYSYGNGSLYAAQTFDNIPASDGRRIQIGWGRIQQPGMPFNQMMLLPTELTLRTTKEGLRLFNVPVQEVNQLQEKEFAWKEMDGEKATEFLQQFNKAVSLRMRFSIRMSQSNVAGLNLDGQTIWSYDMNFNLVNGMFYSPEDRTGMEMNVDLILDRTSVEVFIDDGALSYSLERKTGNTEGFKFYGNRIDVHYLKVYPMKSIWD